MQAILKMTGIGLRSGHYTEFLTKKPGVAWIEVHSENFFGDGGRPLYVLQAVRKDYPVSLHGVGLSLGSADELNWQHLKKLRDLDNQIEACLVSDHLAWSSIDGQYLHDLLPLPYTEEALAHVVTRIQQVQEYLNRQILIENISNYVTYGQSTLTESEFLVEVSKQAGCGILLDINNIYVSATNLNFDPEDYLANIPANLVQEIHLSGFSTQTIEEKEVLVDSHSTPIVPAVWDLYRQSIKYLGLKPAIIEWDNNLPALETLLLEAYRAEQIMRESHVAAKLTG